MNILGHIKYYAIRCIRITLDGITNLIFGLVYRKSSPLPPITNRILLEPASKLAAKIRKGEIKCTDVVKAYITRIREVQPCINAIVDERFEAAILEAQAIDAGIESKTKTEKEIEKATPFLGVPFSCKEAIAVKGMSFTSGLFSRKFVKAETDSGAAKKLKEAGAIPIVATNIPELCMWWETENTIYGTTCNPYDTRRISGGSTGGEAALIGAGASVIGIGNDIGGSIRMPAFVNGIFGHKPSPGVVSNEGQYPPLEGEILQYLSTGPMCRYAVDLLPILRVMSNDDPKLQLEKQVNLRDLKIFYMEDDGGHSFVNPVVPALKQSLQKAVRYFEENYNVKAEMVKLEDLRDSFFIWSEEMADKWPVPFSEEMTERKGKVNGFFEFIKKCFGVSKHTLPAIISCITNFRTPSLFPNKQKRIAAKKLKNLQEQFENLLGENCIFLYPTLPEPAPYHHQPIVKFFNVGYTGIFNLLQVPVTHCPLGLCKGLPIGIQIVARKYSDRLTIAVASELEKAFGGWVSPSPIF